MSFASGSLLFLLLIFIFASPLQALAWTCSDMKQFVDSMYEISDYVNEHSDFDESPKLERSVDELMSALEIIAKDERNQPLTNAVRKMARVWDKEEWGRGDLDNFRNALDATSVNLERVYERRCKAKPKRHTNNSGGSAGKSHGPNNYAALAIDGYRGSRSGVAYNYSSSQSAKKRAISECGVRGCTAVLWFRGGCGAYAADQEEGSSVRGWVTGKSTASLAKRVAINKCRSQGGRRCTIRVWACNTN
ncbi:MAG: DUF4189 domain-containing protein [Mariprofundaceae bacterium]